MTEAQSAIMVGLFVADSCIFAAVCGIYVANSIAELMGWKK
jgi:hypothetical protein